jgi:hypothetical protein
MAEYDDDQDSGDSGSDIPGLRKQARRASQLERELEAARRELAFAKVPGLDTSDPKVGYFVKGYEGEVTPEAIQQAAAAAGFIQAQVPQQVQQDLAGQQAIQQVVQGAQVPQSGGVEDRMDEAFRTGGVDAMLDVVRQQGIPVAGLSD